MTHIQGLKRESDESSPPKKVLGGGGARKGKSLKEKVAGNGKSGMRVSRKGVQKIGERGRTTRSSLG